MGIRTRLDHLLRGKLGMVEGRVREKLPAGLKALIQNPRLLGGWVEESSPWLNRQMLGAASNITEPFLAAMGLGVVDLGEESITVSMPGWWRNQGELGAVHVGALCTLGEFTSRLYWEHHLDLRRAEMSLLGMQVRPVGGTSEIGLNHLKGSLRARYHISTAERESVLHRLRATGATELESEIAVYDKSQKLVAEVALEWRFRRQLSIGGGIHSASGQQK